MPAKFSLLLTKLNLTNEFVHWLQEKLGDTRGINNPAIHEGIFTTLSSLARHRLISIDEKSTFSSLANAANRQTSSHKKKNKNTSQSSKTSSFASVVLQLLMLNKEKTSWLISERIYLAACLLKNDPTFAEKNRALLEPLIVHLIQHSHEILRQLETSLLRMGNPQQNAKSLPQLQQQMTFALLKIVGSLQSLECIGTLAGFQKPLSADVIHVLLKFNAPQFYNKAMQSITGLRDFIHTKVAHDRKQAVFQEVLPDSTLREFISRLDIDQITTFRKILNHDFFSKTLRKEKDRLDGFIDKRLTSIGNYPVVLERTFPQIKWTILDQWAPSLCPLLEKALSRYISDYERLAVLPEASPIASMGWIDELLQDVPELKMSEKKQGLPEITSTRTRALQFIRSACARSPLLEIDPKQFHSLIEITIAKWLELDPFTQSEDLLKTTLHDIFDMFIEQNKTQCGLLSNKSIEPYPLTALKLLVASLKNTPEPSLARIESIYEVIDKLRRANACSSTNLSLIEKSLCKHIFSLQSSDIVGYNETARLQHYVLSKCKLDFQKFEKLFDLLKIESVLSILNCFFVQYEENKQNVPLNSPIFRLIHIYLSRTKSLDTQILKYVLQALKFCGSRSFNEETWPKTFAPIFLEINAHLKRITPENNGSLKNCSLADAATVFVESKAMASETLETIDASLQQVECYKQTKKATTPSEQRVDNALLDSLLLIIESIMELSAQRPVAASVSLMQLLTPLLIQCQNSNRSLLKLVSDFLSTCTAQPSAKQIEYFTSLAHLLQSMLLYKVTCLDTASVDNIKAVTIPYYKSIDELLHLMNTTAFVNQEQRDLWRLLVLLPNFALLSGLVG